MGTVETKANAQAPATSGGRGLTLGQTFLIAALAILVVVGLAFSAFLSHSRASILSVSEERRRAAAHRIEGEVARALGRAGEALENVDRGIRSGAVLVDSEDALEVALFTELGNSPRLAEVTFTRATLVGYDAQGEARLAPEGRFQVSAFRAADGRIVTRVTGAISDAGGSGESRSFAVRARERGPDGAFNRVALSPAGTGMDPTLHPTFSVLAAERNAHRILWSDLHYSEFDQGRPDRRVVLSIQKAIFDGAGRFTGVGRVALLTTDLDAISRMGSGGADRSDPHRIALLAVSSSAAHDARLVARVGPNDRVEPTGDELRVVPNDPPPEISALLSSPLVRGLDPAHPNGGGALDVNGIRYLATLKELSVAEGGTRGWFVAVLVPEAHYTQDLARFERAFLMMFGGTLAAVLAIGVLTLSVVRSGLAEVVATTAHMRRFDFTPGHARSRLRDLDDVMLGLERAKTVVRAMGKYIPLDLVRRLYEKNEEPRLGGELSDVSLMFTDIEGFTTLSERLPPDELARCLGDYLEAVTSAVEAASGTIDKYIGDAVMAFWNAPTKTEHHAARACEAVLGSKDATAALFASPAWQGLPPLVTRYGLHTARVMVGHFGARSRLSYTAIGDGVNLAARLEPLCKQYGVTTLVSHAIVRAAGNDFVFRRIDRVAVKGKAEGIDVFELLGRAGTEIEGLADARRYEEAFARYLARDFTGAAALLADATRGTDAPSRVLLERCRTLELSPPPPDWTGVHVAASK